MNKTRAEELTIDTVIDTEPLYDYFDQHGCEYNEADRMAAEAENEIVESVTTNDDNTVIITTSSVFYTVPKDHPVTVITDTDHG